MHMHKTNLFIFLIVSLSFGSPVIAQESPDQYYRPATTKDLNLRTNTQNREGGNELGNILEGGCPESIIIGGLGEDARVFGNVEIEVNIEEGVIIDCSGI